MKNKSTRLLLLAVLALATGSVARAHAFLDHADPRVGSTVAAPDHVELWMTEGLEPAFTKVQVFDAQGREVDRKDARISGTTMLVSLPRLAPGDYLVKWKAVATDTHRTSGTFPFTVK
jgi:methionine-rich copper-binding protein CopC